MTSSEQVLCALNHEKLAPFRESGGYIFHSDHSIPPKISFDRYRYVMELARKYGTY